jgi:NAD(P)H-flavin reductase
VQVEQDSNTFSGVKDIVDRFKRGKYDDLVIVAPMSMVSKLTELGLRPLWAKMQRVKRQYAECCNNGRHYAFVEFKRIKALEFTFEDELLPV